jgi:hypothetical protein
VVLLDPCHGQLLILGSLKSRLARQKTHQGVVQRQCERETLPFAQPTTHTSLTRTIQYYLCGSGKMALGVKDKLGDIILEVEGGSKEEAAAALTRLSKMSRFAADIFD